jgi:E1A/CREB-binding protein
MQKLPQMARRLEESLFRSAQSFDAYKDTQTLKKRLQALAIAMGLRAQQQKQKSEENSSNSADAGTSDVGNRGGGGDPVLSTSSHITAGDISANAARRLTSSSTYYYE